MIEPSARMERFAVLDTETTGFARSDRIVEIALLTVVAGEVVDEFDTLIQPGRDPGPVHVQGITSAMLQAAPRFADLARDIAARLNGSVIVAHNVHFDLRMLRGEFERIGAAFDPGDTVCTYRLTGKKLSLAAAAVGVDHEEHTALGDARTAAEPGAQVPPSSPGRGVSTADRGGGGCRPLYENAPTTTGKGVSTPHRGGGYCRGDAGGKWRRVRCCRSGDSLTGLAEVNDE